MKMRNLVLRGENIVPSHKSPSVGDDFDHLIAYSIACTLENNVGFAMGHEGLKVWNTP